jgi:DNA helicase-2/ATP-dependent DNA helicase PcrA
MSKIALNPQQELAVHHLEGPLLIIAGAGSGKTRVITNRIAYMLNSGIPQSSILALTFTNKAAREMEERVKEETGKKLTNLTVSTFHAFGVSVLKKHCTLLGYKENFSIYDTSDQQNLLRETAVEAGYIKEELDYSTILGMFSKIKTRRSTWDQEDPHYKKLFKEYQEHLKVYNAMDFDDLIALPIQLFEDHQEVLTQYQERYKYLMIDEFQDTSHMQYYFMHLIAKANRNVCVVGDDDQSIYSWRGANFQNIQNFERDFSERLEIKLEQNYRSTGTILEAANNIIANNKNRKIKELWTGGHGGNQIEFYQPKDEAEEAQFIVDSIKTIRLKEQVSYQDMAILIRTNNLSRNLEEALLGGNIPYKMSGGTSFFQRAEIKDVISYLRTMSNPDDDINLLRILNTPRRGLGKKTIELLREIANKDTYSLYGAIQGLILDPSAVDAPKRMVADLQEFQELIEEWRPMFLGKPKLAETLRKFVDEINYWDYLVGEFQKNDKIAKFRMRNIELFTKILEDWEQNPDNPNPSIFNFLNRISLQNNDDLNDEEDGGKVNLMTIHAAKGLEFDTVFLAGVEDQIIPHARSLTENNAGTYEENLEEERRLFYVAITRAKRHLFISSCQSRNMLRERVDAIPSPFLEEIPKGLMIANEVKTELNQEEAVDFFAAMKAKLRD